ncbi:MAG: trans-sulfuration enzyme family protein [Actinomycetota bacterium]
MDDDRGFTTRSVHSGRQIEPVVEEPGAVPIYQAAPFIFTDMERFSAVGKSKISGGYLYSRWANPTVDSLARTIASLEGAEASAAFASGMGAIHATVASAVRSGQHIVSARQIYGGTFGLFDVIMPRTAVDVTFADITDHDAVRAAFRDTTKVLYFETIGNPTLPVADVEALAAIAHERGATVIVDATFTTPYLFTALEHGVDLVVHSATKYLGGHSDVTAGVVSGSTEAIARIRHLGIDYGGTLAPFEAWLTARGVQTLALRMERICANALAVASALEGHPNVEGVRYPGLPSHPQHDLTKRQFPRGSGGMLTVEVAGGIPAGRRVLERVRIASAAASLGGTKTLILHPASITHTQVPRETRESIGITDGLLRVSVGIEDPDDLIADFREALS